MNTTLEVQNLKCNGCASTIKNKLSDLRNLKEINVDVEGSLVSFQYETEADLEGVKSELKKLGYPLVGEENKLQSKAKSYVSCAVGRMNK